MTQHFSFPRHKDLENLQDAVISSNKKGVFLIICRQKKTAVLKPRILARYRGSYLTKQTLSISSNRKHYVEPRKLGIEQLFLHYSGVAVAGLLLF